MNTPLTGSAKNPPISAKGGKISFRERNLSNGLRKKSNNNQECSNIPIGHGYTQNCGLCIGNGHNWIKCQWLLQGFGIYSMPLIDVTQRKNVLSGNWQILCQF